IGVTPGQTPVVSIDPASGMGPGAMSAADFTKLAGIEAGAQVSKLRQSVFANLASDQTMNSAAYVPLNLSAAITTTAGGKLLVDFSCSAASDAALGTPIRSDERRVGKARTEPGEMESPRQ